MVSLWDQSVGNVEKNCGASSQVSTWVALRKILRLKLKNHLHRLAETTNPAHRWKGLLPELKGSLRKLLIAVTKKGLYP